MFSRAVLRGLTGCTGGQYQRSTLTPHFDGQLGSVESLTALPHGFGAAFTALAPEPLADGEQDVECVHITGGTRRRQGPPRSATS
jgi:hypothetical protein